MSMAAYKNGPHVKMVVKAATFPMAEISVMVSWQMRSQAVLGVFAQIDPSMMRLTDVDQTLSTHFPLTVTRPPGYSYNEHNEACRLLRPWAVRGAKSRSFMFVVHVINNSLLDRSQTLAQIRLLSHLQQLAYIHKLQVLVKCLDYLSDTDDDPYAADEKQLYQGMLAARSKTEMIRLWDDRPPAASSPSPEETTTAEHRISA
ncbi:hypothetical protein CABS01_17175, partial [Colletotrichum abscissum]|uniref:uncharacterized protein n=1 Tax=Colletotrichum abscissum TaxID=1671311 RepID=UPI0027D686B2